MPFFRERRISSDEFGEKDFSSKDNFFHPF